MLELLQSNRMSLLVETLAARLEQPGNPFEPTLVVVQSQGIGQWLKVELAKKLGIAANIDCLLPAELIWRLYQRVLPRHLGISLPSESPFSLGLLSWRIMQLLPAMEDASIKNYLAQGGDYQLRLFQLSHAIALLFDQYLIYRPDWIYAWETGESNPELPWQSDLWQRLIEEPGMDRRLHRANLHKAFLAALASGEHDLPNQINLAGISSLPKMHLETLQAVGDHAQVSIYFLNPSEHYWGDIESEKSAAKRSIREILGKAGPLVPEDYLEVGNPLLSSTGQQGREFLELLLETQGMQTADLFQPVASDSALGQIQADLLNLDFGGEYFDINQPPPKLELKPSDKSIQVHASHSAMREVEILLDQLLKMISDNHGKLKPSDIIVMAPDIREYAPFIEAVFKHKLPFSITDRPVVDESALLLTFEKLISLPDARLTATEVMDLLDVPAVARKFELSEADLATLHYWIRESGIRFEVDGAAKANNWQLANDDYNTWRFGLDRLLLGYAMEPAAGLFAGVAPFDIAPADAVLLGTLCDIIDRLEHHRQQLNREQNPLEWQTSINQLLDDLIAPTQDEEFVVGHIADATDLLVRQTKDAHYDGTVSPRLFRYWLSAQLEQPAQNRGFVSGGITFATLVPMRSIPYACVCLLGMNDREFPREDKPLSFDLMTRQYRKGDRSRRNDDRYLFLEAIMSAQNTLYLSYVGRGQRDNKEKPPSELLSELLDYLNRLYGKFPITEHPLQPFDQSYFAEGSPLFSYAERWRGAFIASEPPEPFASAPIPAREADEAIQSIQELARFFRNPAKYFLNRMDVYFPEDKELLKDAESFALDGLERYQLADEAMQIVLNGGSLDDWRLATQASGKMLPGLPGQFQLAEQIQLAQQVAAEVDELNGHKPEIAQFELTIGNQILSCELPLRNGQYIAPRTGRLRARQQLEAWIHHLALCARGNADADVAETILVYKNSNNQITSHGISALEPDQALHHLTELLQIFDQGQSLPLTFLPEASLTAAEDGNLDKALRKLKADRDNDDMPGTEAKDPYYNRVFSLPEDFDDRFQAVADQIWLPYLQHELKRGKKK